MHIKNEGAQSARDDLQEIVDALQDRRSDAIDQFQQLVLPGRALLELEARRLKSKLGKDAARVQQLSARAAQLYRVARCLGVEEEIASIRTPMTDEKDTLVQGRLLNDKQNAVSGAKVLLVDAKGKPVSGVAAVTTDAAGYYAFVLSPELAAKVAGKGEVQLAVGDQAKPTVLEDIKPIAIVPGTRATLESRLPMASLHDMSSALNLNVAAASAAATRLKTAGKAKENPPA